METFSGRRSWEGAKQGLDVLLCLRGDPGAFIAAAQPVGSPTPAWCRPRCKPNSAGSALCTLAGAGGGIAASEQDPHLNGTHAATAPGGGHQAGVGEPPL